MKNRHVYILVRLDDYLLYQERYGHNRLDRWHRIWSPSKSKALFELSTGKVYEEEIFNGIETYYEITKDNSDYVVKFNSNSGDEYRFDIIKESHTDIYHLAFSLLNNSIDKLDEYEKLTNKKNSLEVFNRLIWILKDITPKLNVSEYCIGLSNNESKNNIYEYMMRFVSGWEKRETSQYDLGWAIYFKL